MFVHVCNITADCSLCDDGVATLYVSSVTNAVAPVLPICTECAEKLAAELTAKLEEQ